MSLNQWRTRLKQVETGQDKWDEGVERGQEQRTIVLAERAEGRWEKWKRVSEQHSEFENVLGMGQHEDDLSSEKQDREGCAACQE